VDVLSLDCNGNTSNDLLSLPTLERDGVGQHRLSPGIHPSLWCLEVMGMDNVISVLRIVIEIVDDNS